MARESGSTRTIYRRYTVDDGWNLPREVIDAIDLAIVKSREEARRQAIRKYNEHRGGWLTAEAARWYELQSWPYRVLYGNQYIKEVRAMGKKLQEEYGVTELEAVNILNGHHTKDYVAKYDRIKSKCPSYVDEQAICNRIAGNYLREAA